MVSRYFKSDVTSVFDEISSESAVAGESNVPTDSSNIIDDVYPSTPVPYPVERACDAWIPCPKTTELLNAITGSTSRDEIVEDSDLTLPGIGIKDDFDDPVKLVVAKYLGEEVASRRKFPTAISVTQDDRGLRHLIQNGCLHAAVNLTSRLLTVYGQGVACAGHKSKHTRHSIRLWFVRISLLVKLRRFSFAELECQAFGDLDTPDLYLQFYPELHGGRVGTLVPFSFRLLLAELPQFLGKHTQALDKLGKLLCSCEQILKNLANGLAEDGSIAMEESFKKPAIKVWKLRRVNTLLAITRCATGLKDFVLSSHLLEKLIHEDPPIEGLYATLGRLSLFLGDISSAQQAFQRHLESSSGGTNHDPILGLLHSSYISSAKNDFQDAVQILEQAHKINPTHPLVLNNLAVAMMYLGDIRRAIETVEPAIFKQPAKLIHEALVLNLCSLYELESAEAHAKKLKLLRLICEHKGDGFNVAALKLQ